MPTLAFDIETIGEKYDDMDAETQDVIKKRALRGASNEDDVVSRVEKVESEFGLSPFTGEIVSIGVLDVEKDTGAVYFQAPDQKNIEMEEDGVVFKSMTEKEILASFWRVAEKCSAFVTFNGSGFDVPYINIRSAIHEIRPSKDIMRGRYVYQQSHDAKHYDLMDQLSYYNKWSSGSTNLHLACRAFGVISPKDEGISGGDVGKLFADKKYLDIARYNGRDIQATAQLYKKWKQYLQF